MKQHDLIAGLLLGAADIGLYMPKMIIERNMNGKIEVHNIESVAEFIVVTPLEGRQP